MLSIPLISKLRLYINKKTKNTLYKRFARVLKLKWKRKSCGKGMTLRQVSVRSFWISKIKFDWRLQFISDSLLNPINLVRLFTLIKQLSFDMANNEVKVKALNVDNLESANKLSSSFELAKSKPITLLPWSTPYFITYALIIFKCQNRSENTLRKFQANLGIS